jgi:hypothetical protein
MVLILMIVYLVITLIISTRENVIDHVQKELMMKKIQNYVKIVMSDVLFVKISLILTVLDVTILSIS